MKYFNTFVYSNVPWIRFLRHFLFWAADITNYLLVISINTEINATEVYRIIFKIPLIIAATYFILYYLIPRMSYRPNRAGIIFWTIALFAFIGIGVRYYKYFILGPLIDPNQEVPENVWDFRRILSEILQGMVVISMAIAIKLIKNKTELQQRNQQLTEEKKIAELNFLKAQMHPHFLFNTLNTLYSDAMHGSGRSELIVLHLSNLLRFILEECSKPEITIGQEIKVIEDYIALEKLRHGDRLRIEFNHSIDDSEKLISPLLLLPFIENSCKHTLNSKRGDIGIRANVTSHADSVELNVENDLVQSMTYNGVSLGLGILNVKKQLNLLYDTNFTLDISKANGKYSVNLKFPIVTKL